MKNRITAAIIISVLACVLMACSGSNDADQQKTETVTQTSETKTSAETETTAESKETTEETTEEETETEETATGPFSDPAAFEGFDTFSCFDGSGVITLGVTTFGDLNYSGTIYDPENLDPGKIGSIVTDYEMKLGGYLTYIIYNPSDEQAAQEDCIIIGVSNYDEILFSNGISYYCTPDEITAVLGEPNEIIEKQYREVYIWRDESGDHQMELEIHPYDGGCEVDAMSYVNFTILNDK